MQIKKKISYSDLFEIYVIDIQILGAMNYIRNIRKKKVALDKIVPNLNNAGTSNWDMESVKENLKEMQTKDIINEHYKPLITLPSDSPDIFIIQVDVCITPGVNYDVI